MPGRGWPIPVKRSSYFRTTFDAQTTPAGRYGLMRGRRMVLLGVAELLAVRAVGAGGGGGNLSHSVAFCRILSHGCRNVVAWLSHGCRTMYRFYLW